MSVKLDMELQTISYEKLKAQDAMAISALVMAASQDGFFYLDLTSVTHSTILQTAARLAKDAEALFDLTPEEKLSFDINRLGTLSIHGYKPLGRNTGLVHGSQDGHELFLIPRDNLLKINGADSLQAPLPVLEDQHTFEWFAQESHYICLTILAALAVSANEKDFVRSHRHAQSSTTAVGLLKYPNLGMENELTGHIAHTDVGSLTLLFCDRGGLQVMHPTSGHWQEVMPRPGHAIINIGDSLHHLSDRTFKSALHRVSLPEDNNSEPRFSVIYFMRPEKDAVFNDETGKQWTSIDWHTRKFDAYRSTNARQVAHILDGRVIS